MLMKSTDLTADQFVNLLMNQEITVYEDVQGTKIWCNFNNGKWEIRPKSINNTPINFIDLAIQKLYKYVWAYLMSIHEDVTRLLAPNLYFCFEYFPDLEPANIKYKGLPLNRLILTCICKNGRRYIYNTNELKVYADLLNVEMLPIIYKGKLSNKQINAISTFISTSSVDLEFLHDETNFSKFFYNLLNPNLKHSYLNGDFESNLEKIIIRFEKDAATITLDILNPLYKKKDNKIDSNYTNIYSVLLLSFLTYIYSVDLDDIMIVGRNREMIYINFMCELYNRYMTIYESDLNNLDFVIPEFFNSDKFKINQILLSNTETINYINKNNKNEYFLKIILNAFRDKMNKKIGSYTDLTLKYHNDIVRKIHVRIEDVFNYNQNFPSYALKKSLDEYPNIKWEEDSKGNVNTVKGKLFDQQDQTNKKKKK